MLLTILKYFLIFFGILICFLDLKTQGYIHTFIIKFIQAFPYFIKDIITTNWKEFRGYGFRLFCGLGGSGKTISIVNELLTYKVKYPKVKIYTNFYFPAGNGTINCWQDLLNITNYEEIEITEKQYNKLKIIKPTKEGSEFYIKDEKYYRVVNHGVIFGFDEIHMTLASDKYKDRPDDLLYYISQQRKLHKLILASSQVFTRVDKILREQTNFIVECKSFLLGRLVSNKYYHTEEYIANDEKMDKGTKKRKVSFYKIFIAKDEIRNSYDTEEIMKDLKVGKSKDKQLTDLIKEFVERSS